MQGKDRTATAVDAYQVEVETAALVRISFSLLFPKSGRVTTRIAAEDNGDWKNRCVRQRIYSR